MLIVLALIAYISGWASVLLTYEEWYYQLKYWGKKGSTW